jgi:hypothetical protein
MPSSLGDVGGNNMRHTIAMDSNIEKTDKIGLVYSVHKKPIGYNSNFRNFEKMKTNKSCDKHEKLSHKPKKPVGLLFSFKL